MLLCFLLFLIGFNGLYGDLMGVYGGLMGFNMDFIPTDELHHFQRGSNHQPERHGGTFDTYAIWPLNQGRGS